MLLVKPVEEPKSAGWLKGMHSPCQPATPHLCTDGIAGLCFRKVGGIDHLQTSRGRDKRCLHHGPGKPATHMNSRPCPVSMADHTPPYNAAGSPPSSGAAPPCPCARSGGRLRRAPARGRPLQGGMAACRVRQKVQTFNQPCACIPDSLHHARCWHQNPAAGWSLNPAHRASWGLLQTWRHRWGR